MSNKRHAESGAAVRCGAWLGGVLLAGYEPGDGTTDGEQMVAGQWWRPRFGCDSLAAVVEAAGMFLVIEQCHEAEKG